MTLKLKEAQNLYKEFLIIQNDKACATSLSDLTDGVVKHDCITRTLNTSTLNSKDVWKASKMITKQSKNNILSIDNSILQKPHSNTNEIINWFYDHTESRAVKGINLISAVMINDNHVVPIGYDIQTKDIINIVKDEDGNDKLKRQARYSINEIARQIVKTAINNVSFDYLTADRWFASKENLTFFNQNKIKYVIGITSNRLVAKNRQDLKSGNYTRIKDLGLKENGSTKVYLKDVQSMVVVTRIVFKNGNTITGEIYLITNDLSLASNHISDIYQKRWEIEVYHKSIKQNVSICKSPTKIAISQKNHLCLALLAFIELEKLKLVSSSNHYALKRKMIIAANKASYEELQKMKTKFKMIA